MSESLATAAERISRAVKEYDGQGWHRTGTRVDSLSARWLRARLADAGAAASLEWHPIDRVAPDPSFLEAGGRRFPGLPMFDGGFTRAEGETGTLGLEAANGILLMRGARLAGAANALDAARRGASKTVVLVSEGSRPGIAPRNAESFREPFGVPVLQVGSEHRGRLEALARAGALVRVVAPGRRIPGRAANVVGEVSGRDGSLPPLCVLTPRSGWWQCASERGTGIAVWLEIARAVARAGLERPVHFVATTGHELGYWGLEEHLARRPGLAERAALWVHLGASIAAAIEPAPHAFASSPELAGRLQDKLEAAAVKSAMPAIAPPGTEALGEGGVLHRAGARYVSLVGGSGVFHLRSDRWPTAIDAVEAARLARALSHLVIAAGNEDARP